MVKFNVKVLPSYHKFVGFSIAERDREDELQRYFPNDEKDNFNLIMPDNRTWTAHRSQPNRIFVNEGREWLEEYTIGENCELEVEVVYRILRIIPPD